MGKPMPHLPLHTNKLLHPSENLLSSFLAVFSCHLLHPEEQFPAQLKDAVCLVPGMRN